VTFSGEATRKAPVRAEPHPTSPRHLTCDVNPYESPYLVAAFNSNPEDRVFFHHRDKGGCALWTHSDKGISQC
jgi:hypothetical protein